MIAHVTLEITRHSFDNRGQKEPDLIERKALFTEEDALDAAKELLEQDDVQGKRSKNYHMRIKTLRITVGDRTIGYSDVQRLARRSRD